MKEHISNHILAAHVAGLFEGSDRKIAAHLLKCPDCRARQEKMISWITPRFSSAPLPSDRLKKRILSTWKRLAEETVPGAAFRRSLRILIPAAGAAAAAAVLVTSIFFFKAEKPGYEKARLAITDFSGQVAIDSDLAKPGASIDEGATVMTFPGSRVLLTRGDGIYIKLFPGSRMTVNHAKVSPETFELKLRFMLHEGRLVSKIDAAEAVEYVYDTPSARITSSGTEFYLESSRDRTRIAMREGSVWVTSLKTGRRVRAVSGFVYSIEKEIESREIRDADRGLFETGTEIKEKHGKKKSLKKIHRKGGKRKRAAFTPADGRLAGAEKIEERMAVPQRQSQEKETLEQRNERLERQRTRREDVQDMRDLRNMRREKR